jgi:5-methylcytosine-specific restriction protein B
MEEIKKEHILAAIKEIEANPLLRKGRASSTYDLIYEENDYPPKLIISIANKYATGFELDPNTFEGGIGTPAFQLLEKEGFEIVKKDSKNDEIVNIKMNFKEAYSKWLVTKIPKDSGSKSSYIRAIDLLSQTLGYSIFEENNIKKINLLYKDLIVKQGIEGGKYWNTKSTSYGASGFYSAAIKKYSDFLKSLNSIDEIVHINDSFDFASFSDKINQCGLIFSSQLIQRFIASLCTKPFVICSGLSGSGKTKLAQAFAQWICYKEEEGETNEQYCIVPVGADWTNREPLLGYPNALQDTKYVKPENGVLDLINRARLNVKKPYFLILDEMNLSHVERYFADFLSTMESGGAIPLHTIENEENDIPKQLNLPSNLFIIGTVNIDETTYMFSPKVLDRANTIEFRLTEKDLNDFIKSNIPLDMKVLKGAGENMGESFVAMATQKTDKNLEKAEADLIKFFKELKKSGAEFGYRTASEIGRLMYMLELLGEKDDNLLDIAIMQKLLPKLHGSRNKLTKVLPVLGGFCLKNKDKIKEDYLDKFVSNNITEEELNKDKNIKYPISFEKICRMYKNAIENGFASYAEA